MVEAARLEATALVEKDPELKNYPLLLDRVGRAVSAVHLE